MNGVGKFMTNKRNELGLWASGRKISSIEPNNLEAQLKKEGLMEYHFYFTKTLDEVMEFINEVTSEKIEQENINDLISPSGLICSK